MGIVGSGSTKGYAYIEEPGELVNQLDSYKYKGKSTDIGYKKIEENWYIYFGY